MTVFETRGSNGHLDDDDGRVGVAEACNLSVWVLLSQHPQRVANSNTERCAILPFFHLLFVLSTFPR